MTDTPTIVEPVLLRAIPESGSLEGSDGRYEKQLADLRGLYRDAGAFESALAEHDDSPVYWVESSTPEEGQGALITGVSVLEPGQVGEEYAMTRGHLHARSDRAELYLGLKGVGVLLLDSTDGRSRAVELSTGQAVYVPGGWVHRSVNVSAGRFVTMFCYPQDAGQDYGIIERAGGMSQLVVTTPGGGWTTRPNPDHGGYVV